MNGVKDKIFEGRILQQVERAVDFIRGQMKERTSLGHGGIFVTEEEYNEFVRTEIVVNAATHRLAVTDCIRKSLTDGIKRIIPNRVVIDLAWSNDRRTMNVPLDECHRIFDLVNCNGEMPRNTARPLNRGDAQGVFANTASSARRSMSEGVMPW